MMKPISFRQRLDLRLAGTFDNISLLSALGGGMLVDPAIAASVPFASALGVALTASGAYGLAHRAIHTQRQRVFTSTIDIRSHTDGLDVDLSKDWGGMLIGYTVDGGKPLVIPWDDLMQHFLVVGTTGVGKTVLGTWMMFQQIMRGGGVVFIDGKVDSDNLRKLNVMCAYAGRRHDLRVINPGVPELSNTYNPILSGDPDEVASRVLSLIPNAEANPGADYYRQGANQGVTTVVDAIRSAGYGYTFLDLAILLQSEKALRYIASLLPAGSSAAGMYNLFLERFMTRGKFGSHLDVAKLAAMFGGVGGRLFSFGSGNFGRVTSTYSPEVSMFDDIASNKIIYIPLPTMGKDEAARQFGKMAVGDYRSAVARIQALPEAQRPWPPTLGYFDEAGAYMTQAWPRLFEQSRSAHQVLVPAVQTVANLDDVSKTLREMVVGNTHTKVIFQVSTEDTARTLADLLGKEKVAAIGVSASNISDSKSGGSAMAAEGARRPGNASYSEHYEEVYRVPPDDLKSIPKGEAIVSANHKIYHVKIPRVSFSDEFKASVGPFEVNRLYRAHAKGLHLFEQFGAPAK